MSRLCGAALGSKVGANLSLPPSHSLSPRQWPCPRQLHPQRVPIRAGRAARLRGCLHPSGFVPVLHRPLGVSPLSCRDFHQRSSFVQHVYGQIVSHHLPPLRQAASLLRASQGTQQAAQRCPFSSGVGSDSSGN